MPVRQTIVIFHSVDGTLHCDDGFAAAWVMKQARPGAMFIPGIYGQRPPLSMIRGADVYLVDFSYKLDAMKALATAIGPDGMLTVLDHHKTAKEELAPLQDWDDPDSALLSVTFDMTKCGSMLTWEHCFPGREPPELLRYIQDGDLWLWELPHAQQVQAALRSFNQDFDVWSDIMQLPMHQLYMEGVAIRRWFDRQVAALARSARPGMIGGYTCMIANAPPVFASELAGMLAEKHPGDFGAVYYDQAEQRVWSLRSRSRFDVSEVAKKFGGGGHKHAAGFSVPLA